MGRQPLPSCKHNLPVNKQLLNFLNVLTYLKMQHPECIGASKFGIDEIYTSWKAFVKKWKSLEERRPLYFVKTDIKNCFDEINQEKLYSIIDGFLKQSGEEEFVVRRFCSIVMSAGRLKRRFHRKVCGLDQYTPDFVKYIRGQVIEENLRNIILIDQVTNQHEFVTDLLQQLHSLLFHNIIQIGKQYFHQKHGISQGSVISTLLCNIYYGQMEARMMNVRDEELLMRIVDDTLFVTPDKNRAIEFLIKMFKGDSEFNFTTNVQKTLINFAHVDDKHGRIPYCNGDWFPWCGFLFNCQTLDVSNDFTRYKGIAITDTITVDLTCRAGKAMKNKLLISLRPKCHALLLDLQINSCAVVITNCYKLFLLTAFKFHCYACHLPYKQRVQDNPAYFLEMILDIASYFYTQILVQANHKFWSEMVLNLSGKTIQWLCLKAFQLKLSQHHSSYKVLLKKMSEIRKIVQKKLKRQDSDLFPVLEELCGDQLPVEFHELV